MHVFWFGIVWVERGKHYVHTNSGVQRPPQKHAHPMFLWFCLWGIVPFSSTNIKQDHISQREQLVAVRIVVRAERDRQQRKRGSFRMVRKAVQSKGETKCTSRAGIHFSYLIKHLASRCLITHPWHKVPCSYWRQKTQLDLHFLGLFGHLSFRPWLLSTAGSEMLLFPWRCWTCASGSSFQNLFKEKYNLETWDLFY